MPTADEGGPAKEPSDRQERRRTPPPVSSRTPPPRTRSGSAAREVEHRTPTQERPRGSLFGRVLGRQGLDEALEGRFQPYEFESTRPLLRWMFLGMLVFIIAGAYAAFTDFEFRSQVDEWLSEDITEIPIDRDDWAIGSLIAEQEFRDPEVLICNEDELATNSYTAQGCRSIDAIFEYAVLERINCVTIEDLSSVVSESRPASPECLHVEEISVRYEDLTGRSNIMSILILVLLLIVAFPFSSFTHRSSRNLRTMKSDGQKHSPDGTVIRFFVPLINVYKPLFMFMELFKASDPEVQDDDRLAWKKKGSTMPVVILWGLAWGAAALFNPITVSKFILNDRDNLDDISKMTQGLVIADILVIVVGLLAMVMVYNLSRRQDARAARFGTVTVTPAPRRDSLEKALEEADQIQESRMAGSRDKGAKRRRR